ncbi:hypothetical protein MC885_017721 [Smutsia gigantea]|nr:hypothetical protein MC885_017721 [Smutsia gigantea]
MGALRQAGRGSAGTRKAPRAAGAGLRGVSGELGGVCGPQPPADCTPGDPVERGSGREGATARGGAGEAAGPVLEALRGPSSARRAGLPRAILASTPGHWPLGFGCQVRLSLFPAPGHLV